MTRNSGWPDVARITLLAPDAVEAVLDGRVSCEFTLATLLEPFSSEWGEQRRLFRLVA